MEGDPKLIASQDIPDLPYHRFAEMIGMTAPLFDQPDGPGPAWRQALAAERPVLIEVRIDPSVPPLPSHITFQQAVNFSKALTQGDPDEAGVIRQTARQVMGRFVHGRDV